MADYVPKGSKPADEDWTPPGARVPVKAHNRAPKKKKGAAETALDFAPAIGGGVGAGVGAAITGGPTLGFGIPAGAIEGATLGGMAGAGVRTAGRKMLGLDTPQGANEVAKQVMEQGVTQGGFEIVGGPIAASIARGGKAAAQAAFKASPEVAQTAITYGITATKAGQRKLFGMLGAAGDNLRILLRKATLGGHKYQPVDLASQVEKSLLTGTEEAGIQGQAISGPSVAKLASLTDQFLREHTGLLNPLELQAIKTTSDRAASQIYKAMAKGDVIPEEQMVEASWHKAMADHSRELLESIDGVAANNAHTQSLIKVKDALLPVERTARPVMERIASRSVGPTIGAGVANLAPGAEGHRVERGLIGAAIGAGLSTPTALSYLGLAANSPLVALIARQGPRGAAALLQK